MNTEQLKTFLTLAESKNFSRTAENLIVSQSAVSKRILELERELNQKLFVRGHGNVCLTSAGKSFLEYAEQIVNMEEKALVQIKKTANYSDYLILGSAHAYYDMHLCRHICEFAHLYPDISVRVKVGHTKLMFNELKRALIDIAFTHHPLYSPDYTCRFLCEDDIALVTDWKNKEYAEGICYSQIKNLSILDTNFLYEPTRRSLFMGQRQFQLEFDVASCAVPLLIGGSWYALLAKKQVASELSSELLREIPICDKSIPPVQHYLTYRKNAENFSVVSKMLSLLL